MKQLKFTGYKETDNVETIQGLNDALKEWIDTVNKPFRYDGQDSIENFEFRSRDGFAAHNHNKGGVDLISISTIDSLVGSGMHLGLTIANWIDTQYDEIYSQVQKDNPTLETDSDEFYNLLNSAFCHSYDAIAYRIRAMYEGDGILRVYAGYDKDAPYFRWKCKTDFEIEIKFKTIAGLKRQLNALNKKIEEKQ